MTSIIEIPDNTDFSIIQYDYNKYFVDKIYASTMNDNLTDNFLKECKKANERHNENLAGEISKEFLLYSAIKNYNLIELNLLEKLQESLNKHFKNIMKEDFRNVQLYSLWINIQEKLEYNPTHNHDGDFSFVWYLQIPQDIRDEHKDSESTYQSKGLIQFNSMFTNSTIRINPKKNDILIFRSEHYHQVYPFYTDNQRISISGNVKI